MFLIIGLLLLVVVGGGFLVFAMQPDQNGDQQQTETDTPSISEAQTPEDLISLAEQFESNHQWTRASEAWTQLIEMEPNRTDAYFRRGLVSYRTENYQQASRDFEQVINEEEDPPPQIFLHTARALIKLDQRERAFPYYQEYQERDNPDPKVTKEIADLARSLEKWSQARQYYETLTDRANSELANESKLSLAQMALQRDFLDRAQEEVDELDDKFENNSLTDRQELHYWYLKAKSLDYKEKSEQADRYYRKIYQRDPSYRDVKEIVEQQISDMDSQSLVQKFQRMDQTSFEDLCRRIVEGMDYEVVQANFLNPEELDIIAREQSMSLRVTRILFAFKQWQETAGELAIKEFEFKLVENRHDNGYFVNPAGYNAAAQNYARGNEKINLLGPEEILAYLHDWYQSGP